MKLAYWDIRGLASPIRNLLRYAAVDFEDEALAIEGPPYTLENWYNQKFTLELDFPNLPYLIDGDLKLTQVNYSQPLACNTLGYNILHFHLIESRHSSVSWSKVWLGSHF